jgi:hypothetical protein
MKTSHTGAAATPEAPSGIAADPSLRDQLDRCHAELVRVRRSLEAAEHANHSLSEAHAELDERFLALTRLHVAAGVMHEAESEAAALGAIAEVMVNLAGTEDFGIYETRTDGGLALLHWFGDRAPFARLAPTGAIGRALEQGTAWAVDAPHDVDPEGGPIACIPLRLGDGIAGVIVVWSFLPQKRAFGPFDVELFALLTQRAAPALRTARLLEGAA